MSEDRRATSASLALKEVLALDISRPITNAVMVPTTAMDTETAALLSLLKW